jgi:hypothetical protein
MVKLIREELDMHFSLKGMALAAGATWGIGMFLLGLASMLFNWGTSMTEMMSSVYIGFAPTFVGSVIGGVWGFVDGAIGGAVFAYLYNKLA